MSAEVALGLATLGRRVNAKARYTLAVHLRSTQLTSPTLLDVNRAVYVKRQGDTPPSLHLYVGALRIAILYDAAGWEVVR